MTTDRRAASVQAEPRGERLLGAVRRERIVVAVRARGVVTVADLVRDLGVSDMTVRRDLAVLADRGLLHRVHGGATSAGGRGPVHVPRTGVPRAGDDARAEVAVRLIEPGGVVALGPGTTTRLLAERIVADPRLRPLTVLTSSTAVARVVDRAGDGLLTAILSGGTRTASDALVGPLARRAFGELPSTLAFVDAYRISSDTGVADQSRDEADVSRSMVDNADRVVVLAGRSAWRPGGWHPVAALDEVDVLVTDDAVPARERERAGSAVGRLVLAPAGAARPARRGVHG
ncbi:DeoR/GlpR family DNA-binding transcription regulator [Cellulosimicrobium cellulans]|uniref:DeoR family transcriptional regulator n=1 Tax=Cellulosimicrobium cellulans TaxID=1710 RepID=A0A4Y4DTK0_CELCE|nr:DeoR/GlpR family DNA-binding transcription regulator [Cellulosimicrobium cellulans]GED08286.1 DeoR family transcriptional regulator [Cellulosimicrobium cellulans]